VIMADAFARATAVKAPAAQALYLGIRDALYAALQADGYIPNDAR
jgi:hypothetical protein